MDSHAHDLPQTPRKELAGERRVLTILFCDVKGSTAMAEQLDPEEWAEIMNLAFEYLTRPVVRYGGTVARLMGDAILAFFGAPTAHEDDPLRAVLAGLEIVRGIQEYRTQLYSEYEMDFNVRVGINTGPVVVGEMGSALAGEYTAMGDAVNLAARMEQTAQPGTVQITEETYRLVSAWLDVQQLKGIEIKGKTDSVSVYRVLGRKETPERARGIRGLASPLIGREREFDRLGSALSELQRGRGQIVTLIGEAGLGKSRLIEELKSRGFRDTGEMIYWVESRGISYESSRPYGLFQQHLRQVTDLEEDDSPEELRRKIGRTFTRMDAVNREAASQVVELLLDLRRGPSEDGGVEGEAFKNRIFASSLELWRGLAEQTPMVLVFDDLHWADPASVELLLHLFQLVDIAPILFLCAFRPYRSSPAWEVKTTGEKDFPHRYVEVTLSPLGEAESGSLVDSLLASSDLPEGLRQLVLDKSEGNPLFLEEVMRTLIDHGILRQEGDTGRWLVAGNFSEIDIPDSLLALLLARIDRLEGPVRRTLQLASVIGRSFFYRVLEAIAEFASGVDSKDGLSDQLATLQRVELIRELARLPELEYIFRHELTRDAAYQSILHRRRRKYHLKVGEVIERLYPDRLDEEAFRLAYHFNEAREFPKALHYSQLAGDRAFRLFANMEASEHYRRAISIARRLETPSVQIARLYIRRGRALELLNQFDAALANYMELEGLGRSRNDRTLELAALTPQAVIHSIPSMRFDPDRGAQQSRQALELAIELGDYQAEAKALWSLMLINNYGTGDLLQAIRYGEQGISIAREHDLREELAALQHDIGRPYMRLGQMDEAWKTYMDSQLYWRETENLPMLADNLTSLAESLYTIGDFDRALELAEEGFGINQKMNNTWGQAYSQMIISMIYLELGYLDRCLETLQATNELSKQANFVAGQFSSMMMFTWINAWIGDVETARTYVDRLAAIVADYESFKPMVTVTSALILLYSGQPEKARELYDSVGSDYTKYFEMVFGPFVYTLDLEIALLSGQYEKALENADHYLGHMTENRLKLMLPDLLNQKARTLLAMDRREEAYQLLVEAKREAEEQNCRRILWAVLVDLAELEPDEPAAESYRSQAREVIGFILEQLSDRRLRDAFLNLPRVSDVMQN